MAAWKFQHLAGEKDAALVTANRARNDADTARDEERWERYRSNIAAAAAALQLHNNDTARPALDAAPLVHRDWEWRHLHSQLDVSSLVVPVPGGPVVAMSLSPSGRQVAVACLDRDEAYLFDVATGKPGAILRGHAAPVTFLAYSPDGQSLATGALDGTIRLWDPASGREVACPAWFAGGSKIGLQSGRSADRALKWAIRFTSGTQRAAGSWRPWVVTASSMRTAVGSRDSAPTAGCSFRAGWANCANGTPSRVS